MVTGDNTKDAAVKKIKKDRALEVANTFEWLITAFILAFFFRAFVMEAFRIPTNSMAATLMGAHFRMVCYQCGYEYNSGFNAEEYRLPRESIPTGAVVPPQSRCPSCGFYPVSNISMDVTNGDRLLVLKCMYQLVEPKRWDVVVFKNPSEPKIDYIKRLIAKPYETVEIIDGDVYVDGKIQRKPPKVQDELWMPVYNNNYRPINPDQTLFNGHKWQVPFDLSDSEWTVSKESPTLFVLDGKTGEEFSLKYDTSAGNNFRATYACNNVDDYSRMPYCSDIKIKCRTKIVSELGEFGVKLSKYDNIYKASIDKNGKMTIKASSKSDVGEKVLAVNDRLVDSGLLSGVFDVEFANVDHMLIFKAANRTLTYDLGVEPNSLGLRITEKESDASIFGSGQLQVNDLSIWRDIHYIDFDGPGTCRAKEGHPLKLGKDEFFVMGDNSPASYDSRWWVRSGIGNNGKQYSAGVVPRDYLVGKAAFVYWPGGFDFPWPAGFKSFLYENIKQNGFFRIMYTIVDLKWVPNISKIRFIYGGSDKQANSK